MYKRQDVNVTFPEDYGHKELAGKPAVFKVVLHSIQFSELPELDDDFAVDVSDFDTLDEYKADVKAKIAEKYENSANNAVEGQIIDGLLKNLTVDIPDCMIDSETENLIRERDYSLRSQGLDLNTYLKYMNSTLDDMRAQLRPMAERQVKTRLALEKIAEIENIKAEEADINAEYEKMAVQYSMAVSYTHLDVYKRQHTMDPVPFFIYNPEESAKGVDKFTEDSCSGTGLYIPHGYNLLDKVIVR